MVGERLAAARAGMDRQTRRLVDDEQQGIAVEEARAYVEGVGHPDRLEGSAPGGQGGLRTRFHGERGEARLVRTPVRAQGPEPGRRKPEAELPAEAASPSEGQPDFATAAEDVDHVPLPPEETGEPVADVVEGRISAAHPGRARAAPAGTAGDAPEHGAEPVDTSDAVREPMVEPAPDIQPLDSAAALAHDAGAGPEREPEAKGWWTRLTSGMKRTSSALSEQVTGLFTKRKLDATTLEDLEDALIQADFGLETAMRVSEAVGKGRYEKGISPTRSGRSWRRRSSGPSIRGDSADRRRRQEALRHSHRRGERRRQDHDTGQARLEAAGRGRTVMLAAGDTFRAAAIDQLKVWGARTGTPVVSGAQGADAAGLAFDALKQASAAGTDVLLIDTAGRLQNKAGLMAELEKIVRVLRKQDPDAPHATLLVLDATVGQNALSQVELFSQAAPVSGLVMTKLDGTARGGILVALAAKFGLPVHFIGVGEGVEDLEPFAARDFARAIAGLEKD
ncbi:signal recognition particle receptor subunit alpha [Methylobacterium oryzae CBMB20]